jgi:glycosyltransferase involved in cell wall biosynthesis
MKRIDCIYFSPIPWGALYQRPQHMVSLLARHRRVLFVEPRTLVKGRYPHGLKNIQWLPLPVIPYNARNPMLRRLALWSDKFEFPRRLVTSRQVDLLKKICHGQQPPLLIFGHPEFYPLQHLFPDSPLVYDHMDDILHFGNQPTIMEHHLRSLVKRCDLVAASSGKLAWQVAEMGAKHVILAGNGVEWERFTQAETIPEPRDLARMPRPRAIYVGSVAEWFDFELLFQVARNLPGVTFPVVGPLRPEVELQRSRAPENVHFLGPRPYEKVPALLQHSDCALIPFICNQLTAAVDPVKLHEYFAAGLPVVATPFSDELDEYKSALTLTGNAADFASAVQRVTDTPPAPEQVRQLAAGHTWEARLLPLFKALDELAPLRSLP